MNEERPAKAVFTIDAEVFKKRALRWAQRFGDACLLQSNGHADEHSQIDGLIAAGALDTFTGGGGDTFGQLEKFREKHSKNWMFGFFGYDLKNETEDLATSHPDRTGFPDAYFFVPESVLRFRGNAVEIEAPDPQTVFQEIVAAPFPAGFQHMPDVRIRQRMPKADYMKAFDSLLRHIRQGDIYEANLCQEFYAENVSLSPVDVYERLNRLSPAPFSGFFKTADKYVLSASPERFLAKRGDKLISQPIKGTAPRGKSDEEDRAVAHALRNSPKEIAENVMIVDLVRNDLTRSARAGTVRADRLLEVQTFRQVHQLVSTVTCRKRDGISDAEAIRNTFPPGSMTGAPKISAMRLCDQYESSKRGVYAGAMGYFAPSGDFDFNVVIRTLLYDRAGGYLSFHTGSAITIDANPEREYAECLLKAKGILETLNGRGTLKIPFRKKRTFAP